MLKVVAGAQNQPQGELIVERLAAAGITAISQLSSGNPEFGAGGGRTIYVEERDADRAREILATDEQPISEEELTRLSEAAGRDGGEDPAG
jgi:hypothetical protein